jgi:hypothetical protein
MRSSSLAGIRTELSSREIRTITARITHPEDPLTEWRFEFDEWRKAYAEFQQMEKDRFLRLEPPTDIVLREHRYVLFLLMTQGEELGLILLHTEQIQTAERDRLIDQIDGFLGSLRDSWHTWHGESLPQDREALAKFFS